MRLYETTFILRPTLEEENLAAAVERFVGIITDGGGSIEGRDDWGKRRLAYEIDGERDGHYVILRFRANPETVRELERIFRISEEVLRYLVVRWEVPPAPPPRPARAERASPEVTAPEEAARPSRPAPQPPVSQEVEGDA